MAGCANPSSRKRFQGVGRQNLQLPRDAFTSEAAMLRQWANLSAIPPAYHTLGIDASEAGVK
jgi:hypothetical protein